jgi:hypothetical protein
MHASLNKTGEFAPASGSSLTLRSWGITAIVHSSRGESCASSPHFSTMQALNAFWAASLHSRSQVRLGFALRLPHSTSVVAAHKKSACIRVCPPKVPCSVAQTLGNSQNPELVFPTEALPYPIVLAQLSGQGTRPCGLHSAADLLYMADKQALPPPSLEISVARDADALLRLVQLALHRIQLQADPRPLQPLQLILP